jgi:SAM-dependent methyltransferase
MTLSSLEYNIHTYKDYWRNANLVPSKAEDKQLPLLIDTLKKEPNMDTVASVLEVGVGYGRIAKAIIDTFPDISLYHGMDISSSANNLRHYRAYIGEVCDFDSTLYWDNPVFDLVISVETLSIVPIDVSGWINKMISLSKKYCINVDFTRGNDTITGLPPKDYSGYYNSNPNVLDCKEIEFPNNESAFIVRVR